MGDDKMAIVCNTSTGNELRLDEHHERVTCVAILPKGDTAVSFGGACTKS